MKQLQLTRTALAIITSCLVGASFVNCGGGDENESTAGGSPGGGAGAGLGGSGGGWASGSGGSSMAGGSSGAGGGTSDSCQTTADCTAKMPATTPAGCAEASCDAGRCVYRAKDTDGDGDRAASCRFASAGATIDAGQDCDDNDASVSSKAAEACDGKDNDCNSLVDDGVPPSSLPCETELQGICKGTGVFECHNGTYSKCNAVPVATPGPAGMKECDKVDRDCDGKINNDPKICFCTPGEPLPCSQECGTNYEVICTAQGEHPGCNPGPSKGPYCPDLDNDGFGNKNACQTLCPSQVPSGWKPQSTFDGKQTDCNDQNASVYPGAPEACDGVDSACDGNNEPQVTCGSCGSVNCGSACPICPPNTTFDPGLNACLSNIEIPEVNHEEWGQAPPPFCFGVSYDEAIYQGCAPGHVRSKVVVEKTNSGGNSQCYGNWAVDDIHDCSVWYHIGAALCDIVECSVRSWSKQVVAKCQ